MQCVMDDSNDSITACVVRLIHNYSSMNFNIFKELEIHPGQLPVLINISRQEGISLRELADTIHIKPPTVTVTIQRLEKAGLVYKKADASDQRISRIYLTEKGKNIQRELDNLFNENERILTKGFSGEEQQLLREFLRRMTENMRQEKRE